MDFIKMIMELPGEKRSQDVVEHTEWNSLWKLIVTQGNHSENYLEQLYDYFFNKEEGWVHKVQAELDGVQPYVEGVMTQPVGKAPDGSLWTYPSTESGTVPWGNVMGDITKQQDLIQKLDAKADTNHKHSINTLTFNEGDIDSLWISYSSQSVPMNALIDGSVTTEKLNNGAVTTAKIASGAVINDSIANGSVSGVKISDGAVSRAKLARDALYSPVAYTSASEKIRRITVNDIGKTLYFSWVSGESSFDTTFSLSLEDSSKFPAGGEIAICYYHGKSCSISFTGGLKVDIAGEGRADNRTIKIPEKYGMVALKKMFTSNGADYWLVTGNVEVVE